MDWFIQRGLAETGGTGGDVCESAAAGFSKQKGLQFNLQALFEITSLHPHRGYSGMINCRRLQQN